MRLKTPLIVFAALFFTLLCLDAMVLSAILDAWLIFAIALFSLLAFFALTGVSLYRVHQVQSDLGPGWLIGQGIELTNPSKPRKSTVLLQQKALNLGFLGIGSPGSGKTVSLGVGYIQHLRRSDPERGWCIIDGKGDIDYYLSLVKADARPAHFISSELPGSDSINLFAGEPMDVVDRCMRFLIPTTFSTTFYSDEQRTALMTVVPLMKKLGQPSHLRDFYTVLTVEDAAMELLSLAKAAPGVLETDLELAKQWFAIDFEERFRLNKGLINRLSVFCVGEHNDRFNVYHPDVDINDCMLNGKSLFLHLPYSEFSKDIAIAVVEMFGVEARRRQLAGPERFQSYPLMFEDYGGFFHENFGPISSRCRSARMPLSFTFQSMSQVQRVGEAFKGELDDNLPTKIVFRVMGLSTSGFAVELLGDFETREVSSSEMGHRDGSNMHHERKDRISVRELRELSPGEAYVSTLLYKSNRQVVNPLYRVQFPETELDNSINAQLPAARRHGEGEGLGLWSKYMSPSRLRDIQRQVHQEMVEAAEVAL